MKIAILLIATLVGLCNARLISQEIETSDATVGEKSVCFHCGEEPETEWYTSAVFYQIYPKSFKDSNGDGIGDLKGIKEKLPHLKDLGVDGVWLSPVFASPQKDGGYDISDFTAVDPIFGTMEDMEALILEAKRLKIKLILDFVPNHSSNEHQWFKDSENRVPGYEDYYVWRDCKAIPTDSPNNRDEPEDCEPPNNWVSVFAGSAWEWSNTREQFYLHQFVKEQPDLNFRNPRVKEELKNVLKFWMKKGIDGFRVDAINHAFETENEPDEPVREGGDPTNWNDIMHIHTKDQPESYELVYDWRDMMDEDSFLNGLEPRLMMTEAYTDEFDDTFKWFADKEKGRIGSHVAFNFILVSELTSESTAEEFVGKIVNWTNAVPEGAQPNWVLGNHDRSRVASRYGRETAEALAILSMTLPGIAVVYNGEEIGMTDYRDISWEETQDPQACNTNDTYYQEVSRDPVRTPFHWDNTKYAGFSDDDTEKTWLPVNPNKNEINLKAQKESEKSTYKLYQSLIKLRKLNVFKFGELKIKSFENTEVFGYLRHIGLDEVYAIAINLGEDEHEIDLTSIEDVVNKSEYDRATVILATNNYEQPDKDENGDPAAHSTVDSRKFKLGGHQGVVLKLFVPHSGAAGLTISLTLLCAVILRAIF